MAQDNTQTSAVEAHGTAATDEGLLASLGINAQLFVFQLINFAVVAVIIWFLILKPLTRKMEERKKMIDESIDNAKAVETNLKMSEKKYQERIDQAKVEANKLIEEAHGEALVLGEEMKKRSQKDIELLVDQAKRNIVIEREEAMEGVRKEIGGLVAAAVEKVVGEKINEKTDKKIIEDALKELRG
jgi:F-type H+-transporting ATPase subunit b